MNIAIKIDPKRWQKYMAVKQKGRFLLRNSFTNKGSAFTSHEREKLDLTGLLPPHISTIEQQLERNIESFRALSDNLEKFSYLESLHDRNETLFYRFLYEYIEETIPIVYTPTVGEACQKFSHIYRRARGLYISYNQMNNIEKILRNFYVDNPSIIVVTDGERILGLGDQGADGLGIPIGKLCLYTLGAGISPYSTLPIVLDVGTDNEERRKDPLYLGLRQKRIRGQEYQEFVDKFIEAVIKVFPNVLLQWEDFLKSNAIKQLNRFKDRLCTFNDDIQGTGSAALAFIYKTLKITDRPIQDNRILIAGAGAAAHGISGMLVSAMHDKGLSVNEARKHIYMVDSKGLVISARSDLEDFKMIYARDNDEIATYVCNNRSRITLEEAIANAKPTILIGTSAVPGLFNKIVVEEMSEINKRPIICPISNPSSKSECLPEDAIRWSEGRAIVATGSPFEPVIYNGKRYNIAQCNNFFIFPGIGLGVTVGQIRRVTNGMFLAAAKAFAESIPENSTDEFAISPQLCKIRDYSHAVACAVIKRAVIEGHADEEILVQLEQIVKDAMWFPEYLPIRYER